MDTPTAEQILQSLITSKTNELASLNLALSILNTTFAPDLTAIKTAQADADTQRTQVSDLTEQLSTANATVSDLTTQLAAVAPAQPDIAIPSNQLSE